ncbi:uncharacterized protein LOC130665746 [Microplitis mediator]|uniref:uncharacterized protein LOC130665746 n=1 Tax=Microplitis mediator TaxID=375433 RepID=UPI00255637A0|nr:uncharacterized protein LOC130665746 [Microplitis mediator]
MDPDGRKLTRELIRDLISKDEPEVEILSLDEEPGSGRGDNYTSMLYRMRVNGRKRLKSGELVAWNTAIIYKVLPESKARREAFKSESLFKNEVVFYNKVWPALNELQTGKKVFGGVAKIYVARSDLIAMEDLKIRGFVMADRRQGLELNRLKLVLKALAGFHALSLTLRDLRPEVFERLADENDPESIREGLFRLEYEDWYRHYYRVAVKNAITMVSEALPIQHEHKRNEVLGKLQNFLHEDVFFHTMCELASTRGPFTVFCHGDCWTNNFLFSESDTDEEAVYLVDFQLLRVGSLALDLVNLLYCCTSGQVRRVHMTSLLAHYHQHLMKALNTLNPQQSRDSSVTWELLNEEVRKCGRFGFGIALDILPISTCDSDNAPDLYEGAGDNTEEVRNPRAPPPGGDECARLMTELVLELIQNRAL